MMKNRKQSLLKLVPLEILVIAGIFLLSLFVFSFIVHEALFEQEDVFDKNVIHFFSAHSSETLIEAMKRITFFGSTTFLFPAYIVLLAWYIFKKKFQYALDIGIIALSSTAMMFALKKVFHRHRPPFPIIKGITGYSFPSGHALSSFIFCTILIYLVWKGTLSPAIKPLLIFFLSLCPIAIGLSRIILNVHYATDVIGGFCLAIAWVIASFEILKKIRNERLPGEARQVV
ncbi:MAG: phosphatase PAP2 family protein [Chitinophagaceae bacterium]